MRLPRLLPVGLALVVLCTQACTPQPKRLGIKPQLEIASGIDARFRPGGELLEGFDTFKTSGQWRAGDCALLGIAMDAPGISREWYLKVTVLKNLPTSVGEGPGEFKFRDTVRVRYTGKDSSAPGRWVRVDYELVPVLVELFDQDLRPLSHNVAMMPEICLQYGLIDNIELQRDGRGFYDSLTILPGGGEIMAGDEQKRFLAGWVAMMKLPEFLHRESMQDVLWELIERPSLFSMLRYRGVSLGLSMEAEDAKIVEPPPLELPAPVYRVPLAVEVNGTTAMNCELMLARAVPPLGPCNGLVGLDAVNPRDARKRVTVRLLAARNRPVTTEDSQPSTLSGAPAPARPAAASPAGTGP